MISTNIMTVQVPKMKKKAKPRKRRVKYGPKKLSMAARLLDEIESRGGMTVQQIKKFVWELGHPNTPFDPKLGYSFWNTALYGTGKSGRRPGLLHFFCEKKGRRTWVRNSVSHEEKPYEVMTRTHKSANTWKASWASGGQIVMTYVPIQQPGVNP